MPATTTIQFRRGTSADWTAADPVLSSGEPGFETDSGKYKIGDGTTTWMQLPYFSSQSVVGTDYVSTATLLPQLRAPRVGFLGDSITVLNGDGVNAGDNFNAYWVAASLGRVLWGGTIGFPGKTTDYILANGLPVIQSLPTSQRPRKVLVLAGTNDVGSSFPTAMSATNLTAIYNALIALDITPIAATIPPRGDSTSANNLVGPLNDWIRINAGRMGLDCFDFWTTLVDPTTGLYAPGNHISDNIHPSAQGFLAMSKAALAVDLFDRLANVPTIIARTSSSDGDATPFAGGSLDPLFMTGGGGGSGTNGDPGIAMNIQQYDSGNDYKLVAPTSEDQLPEGSNWQQVSVPPGGSAYFVFGAPASADHRYAFGIRFQTSGFSSQDGLSNYNIGAIMSGGTSTSVNRYGNGSQTQDISDGLIYDEGPTAPSGTNSVAVSVQVSSNASATAPVVVRVACPKLIDLTALGLD